MSAQPNFPTESFDEALDLRMRIAEALCSLVESLAMTGKIRHARRAMDEVRAIAEETSRVAATSPQDSAAAQDLRSSLSELQHRVRNAETVLKLLD